MLLELDDDGYKILLAKALGGLTDPEALRASADVLTGVKDIAIQTTLVRFLSETPDAAQVVAQAFTKEENPNVRAMFLREYARRIGEPDLGDPEARRTGPVDRDAGRDLFRKAALEDADPTVRAEAVSIIGRRADARDVDLMADIVKHETNLQIRQSAIVAYATTANEMGLPMLEDLARREESLEIRASAVLAIARVGTDRAIALLEQIAQSDSREEIRTRAQGFAQGLRARAQAEREELTRPKGDVPQEPPADFAPGVPPGEPGMAPEGDLGAAGG
jgi:hypothetical protein